MHTSKVQHHHHDADKHEQAQFEPHYCLQPPY
jgi:hypothetical protein